MSAVKMAGTFLALAGLAACGNASDTTAGADVSPSNTLEPPTMDAYTVLMSGDFLAKLDGVPADCDDLWAAKGIRIGSQVKVTAADGSLAAIGEVEELKPDLRQADLAEHFCVLGAEIPDLTSGGRFYEASIGEWKSEALAEHEIGPRRFVILVDLPES